MEKKNSRFKEGGNAWLITFADLMTNLLVLFVLLYSYSTTDLNKFRSVIDSFNNNTSLSNMSGADGGEQRTGEGAQEQATGPLQRDPAKEEPQGIEGEVSADLKRKLAELMRQEKEIAEILGFVQSFAQEHDLEGEMKVSYTNRGIELTLPEVMLFESGRDVLLDDAIVFLDKMAPLLKQIPNAIEVEGHTDDRPISTSRFPSNWDLSTARANRVIRYLVEKHGIDPRRFKSVGYGEFRPVASNDTEEGRRKNRRVVMIIEIQ
ncbi:OmpA family protein [Bacillaceae bacterium]